MDLGFDTLIQVLIQVPFLWILGKMYKYPTPPATHSESDSFFA
jgi:hypothetical protein